MTEESTIDLRQDALENLNDTLAKLHGKKTADPKVYHQAIEEGLSPKSAWSVFEGTFRDIDCWQELEDCDALLEVLVAVPT